MKKISFLLSLILIMGLMLPPVHAAPDVYQETSVIHTEFGDIEIETTTIVHDSLFRSSSKSADQVASVKMNGKVIANVTLSATFGYDGKTAWVSSASGSHTTYDGWSYGSETISKSGGTATLSAKVSHLLYGSHSVNISLTCSPTGQIS